MEQNFDLLAQSRANYYTKGSPVQFVRVELLKGDVTGEIAVCLSFKNISEQKIAGLVVRFKCKNRAGAVICDDQFYYEHLNVRQGEVFGGDDAVCISTEPVGSVEVELDRMFLQNGSAVALGEFKRARLPGPRALPDNLAKQLQERTSRPEMSFVPQVLEQGWYCACGAFHPNEENTVYCSECGCDRILLQNALSGMLQQNKAPAPPPEPEPANATETGEATRIINREMTEQERFAAEYRRSRGAGTAVFQPAAAEPPVADEPTRYTDGKKSYAAPEPEPESELYEDELDSDDELATNIIRWAPPITVILCAVVIAFTVVYHLIAQ